MGEIAGHQRRSGPANNTLSNRLLVAGSCLGQSSYDRFFFAVFL